MWEKMGDFKERASFRHSREDVHANSETVAAHVRFEPDKTPALRWRSGRRLTPIVEKLFATDFFWERENQFFSNGVSLDI